jgi:DNA-binding SARP family transcriptional activator/tetratricopeptide (TPR) repeat protein
VSLCGPLAVELDGRRVEDQLPGRQGRLVLAYLVVCRGRPATRDELVDLLWPQDPPASPETSLRPLLTRLRRALGEQRLVGRAQLGVDLGPNAWVDVEVAETAATRAEAALDAGGARDALAVAQEGLAIVERPFLPDVLTPWAEERRQELQSLEAPLLEVAGRAALALGPAHRGEAERLARRLVEREPYRESGHALLMEVLTAQGNVVEALRVFDTLRVRLREELGVPPAPGLTALHERLLHLDAGAAPRAVAPGTVPELPPPLAAAGGGAFVGRSEALAAIEAAWARALERTEQIVFVGGEPGVGKTRLVARVAAGVHAAGATVLYGRCDEEVLMPYQPVVEALRHAVRHAPPLSLPPDLARELARLVPEVEGEGGPAADAREPLLGERDTQRYRLFEAVATALGQLAGDRGLLLVLDDLHWADRTTLLLLRFLARIDGSSPVLLLATYREDEVGPEHPLADLLADVRRDRRAGRVSLTGLDAEETAELVAARLSAGTSEGFVRRLQAQTSGNPFFIEETLRDLDAPEGRLEEDELERAGVPEGVGDVIMRRLGGVGSEVQEVLAVAAVVGREFDLDVVAAALERSDEDVLSAVERAMQARLVVEAPAQVDRFTFCHALVRETLYDRQAASRRLRRHLRVGEALERPGRPRRPAAAELARHFVAARALSGTDRALGHVLDAAREATATLAYEEAAAHLRRALDLQAELGTPDAAAQRCETLLSLGRVLWRAGDPAARDTFGEAAALAREEGLPEPLARAVLGMTGRFYEAGIADPVTIGLLEEALAALGDADSSLRARLLARLSDQLHVAADEERRAQLSAEAVAMARRLDDPDALTVALIARHAALLHVEHLDERLQIAAEQLELARSRGRAELVAFGLHWRIYDHLELGDGAAARSDEAELAAVAGDLRQPLYRYLDRCWQAVLAQLDGRLDDADALSADAFAMGRRAGAKTAASTRLGALVTIRRDQGRLGELVDDVRAIVAQHPAITTWRGFLPLLLAESGRAGEARDALDALEADGFAELPRDLFWLTTVLVLGEAAASIGSDAQREALHDLLAPYAHRCVPASLAASWGSAARVVGRLASALGRHDEAEERFGQALRANEELGAVAAVVRTRIDHAHALAARGEDARAAGLLDVARAQARELGLAGLAA